MEVASIRTGTCWPLLEATTGVGSISVDVHAESSMAKISTNLHLPELVGRVFSPINAAMVELLFMVLALVSACLKESLWAPGCS